MAYFTPEMMSLLILLAVGWKLGGATDTQRSHMYSDVGLNDKAFTENVVFESSAKSELHCARKCNQQDSCAAFTLDNTVCRGHTAVMTSQSQSRHAAGARSFSKVNMDVDECESNPCLSGEGCEDTVSGYNCCPPGYSGTTCSESWLKATCTANADCAKNQTKCYSGHCLCADGLFFSHSQAACVQTCDQPDTNYLHYKDTDLTGTVLHAMPETPDSTTCAAQCSSDPQCITFILFGGTCYMKSFTGQGPEDFWQAKTDAQMYQRTCE